MEAPRQLFLNVCRDKSGRVWGVARMCLADGSCLVIESRIYKTYNNNALPDGREVFAGVDEDDEPAENQALDEALDKLCKLTQNRAIMRAVPLPARLALKLVCTARNLKKIKDAAENEGDDELAGRAHARLRQMSRSKNATAVRAHRALGLWR